MSNNVTITSRKKMNAILLLSYTLLGLFVNGEMLSGTVFRALRATADNDSSQSRTISALGRSFTLGALYNGRTDKLVSPGVTLWDLDTLKKNLHAEDHPYSKVVFSAGNSVDQKASLFDISAELKRSLLAGLVKVKGAAKYLNKKPSSNYMAEVSLLYKTTTHFEQLTMELLAADKIEYPQVLDKEKEATHIVTKIVYGANVVLSLTKEVNRMSQMEEVHGRLKSAAKWIASSISGSVPMDLTDEQKRDYNSFTVDFYKDVSPRKPPITFSDAVETCKTLPSLINKTTAIPIQVHLSPLSRLDSKNSRLVKNISASLWRKTEKRLEKYDKISRNIGDLRKYAAYQSLHSFKDHVNEFQSALDVHKIQFDRKLLHVVPKIRGGGMEEIELAKILDESKSSFTMNKLEQWTVLKKREARTLKHLLSVEPNIIYAEPGSFDQLLADFSIHFVVVLKLKLYPISDPYTKCLAEFCNSTIKYNSWLTRKIRKQMRKASVQYIRMYSLNKKFLPNPNTAYAILEELHHDAPLHVAIQVFENGEEMESNFQFPSITITTTDVKCEETNISWMTTEKNTYVWLTDKYHVGYKQNIQDSWTTYTSMEASTTINISPGYMVLIMANCKFGICANKKITVQDVDHCTVSRDCADIKEQHPEATSGTYEIKPSGSLPMMVFCDMRTLGGGWTVFQRRMNGEENFRRNWADYKKGFGNIAGEHWLGNGAIHSLTYSVDSPVELLVELQETGLSCVLNAQYSDFYIGTEKENYKLFLGKFVGGSAGDSGQGLSNHNATEFSTIDKDNDKDSCANQRNGGWWYMKKGMCEHANLNGLYNSSTCVSQFGHINWGAAHGPFYSFPWTEMKLRRSDFK